MNRKVKRLAYKKHNLDKKPMRYCIYIVFILIPLLIIWLYLQSDNNISSFGSSVTWEKEIPKEKSLTFNNGIARFELDRNDRVISGSKRCEISTTSPKQFSENIYKFKVLLPNNAGEEYKLDSNSEEILLQLKGIPDKDLNEKGNSPSFALLTSKGHWKIDSRWDTNPNTVKANFRRVDLGEYTVGKWTEWEIHVKWGWLPEHNTILEIYKDGVKLVDLNGQPNTTNDVQAPYLKLGIYKWQWMDKNSSSILDKRVVYFKDVVIQENINK